MMGYDTDFGQVIDAKEFFGLFCSLNV